MDIDNVNEGSLCIHIAMTRVLSLEYFILSKSSIGSLLLNE